MDVTQPLAYCPRCGTPRLAGARFCGRCGTDLEALGATQPREAAVVATPPAARPPGTVASSDAGQSSPLAPSSASASAVSGPIVALGAGGIAAAISPFLPWAGTDLLATMTGVDLGGIEPTLATLAGLVILGCAVALQLRIAAPIAWRAAALVAALIAGSVAIHTIDDAARLSSDFSTVSVGLGVYVLALGAAVAIVAAALDHAASRAR